MYPLARFLQILHAAREVSINDIFAYKRDHCHTDEVRELKSFGVSQEGVPQSNRVVHAKFLAK